MRTELILVLLLVFTGAVSAQSSRSGPAVGNQSNPDRAWFSVWYVRTFVKRDGRWIYLSHRTVHGPTYGPDRRSVSDK